MSDKGLRLSKEKFDRDGYTVISGLFSATEIDALNVQVDRYVKQIAPTLSDGDVFYEDPSKPASLKQLEHMNKHDEFFRDYMADSRFRELGELLLDVPLRPMNQQWFNKPPAGSSPTPPHQDGFYFSLEPNEAANMWLALDPVSEKNGCLHYVAGSHRRGLRPHGRTDTLGFSQGVSNWSADDDANAVAVAVMAGDLIVHHSLVIHRAEANHSNDHRRALGGTYYSTQAVVNDEAHRKYIDELENLMTEKSSGTSAK